MAWWPQPSSGDRRREGDTSGPSKVTFEFGDPKRHPFDQMPPAAWVTLRVTSICRMGWDHGAPPGTHQDRSMPMRSNPTLESPEPLLSVEEAAVLLGETRSTISGPSRPATSAPHLQDRSEVPHSPPVRRTLAADSAHPAGGIPCDRTHPAWVAGSARSRGSSCSGTPFWTTSSPHERPLVGLPREPNPCSGGPSSRSTNRACSASVPGDHWVQDRGVEMTQ